MNKEIWKFDLNIGGQTLHYIPENAEILTLQTQHGNPCIWALVDPDKLKVLSCFETFNTGQELPLIGMERKYIGTYQLSGGSIIKHVFELIKT